MKVGIFTIIDNDNYGNRLQNYAIQQFLKKLNIIAETLKNYPYTNSKKFFVLRKIKWKIKKLSHKDKLNLNAKRLDSFMQYDKNIVYYEDNDNSMTSTSKKILKKCKDFTYSLTEIDKATHKRYSSLVANQKINLLEKEMRLCKNINEYKEICNEIEIEEYSGKKVNLKIFSKIYKRKKLVILKIYYFLRKFLKKLRNLLQFSK